MLLYSSQSTRSELSRPLVTALFFCELSHLVPPTQNRPNLRDGQIPCYFPRASLRVQGHDWRASHAEIACKIPAATACTRARGQATAVPRHNCIQPIERNVLNRAVRLKSFYSWFRFGRNLERSFLPGTSCRIFLKRSEGNPLEMA